MSTESETKLSATLSPPPPPLTTGAGNTGAAPLVEQFQQIAERMKDQPGQEQRLIADRERDARNEERRKKTVVEMRRRNCGVWPRYEQAKLEDVAIPRAMLSHEQFAAYLKARDTLAGLLKMPGIVVLCGANGPGKTRMASALVHAFCDQGRPALYTTAMDFFRKYKSTFDAPGQTADDYIQRLRKFDLIVIDEIEVRAESTWENAELRDLVNSRYAMNVATVLISNKTKEELEGGYLGPALRDRIRESGALIVCNWPSLRAATMEQLTADERR